MICLSQKIILDFQSVRITVTVSPSCQTMGMVHKQFLIDSNLTEWWMAAAGTNVYIFIYFHTGKCTCIFFFMSNKRPCPQMALGIKRIGNNNTFLFSMNKPILLLSQAATSICWTLLGHCLHKRNITGKIMFRLSLH